MGGLQSNRAEGRRTNVSVCAIPLRLLCATWLLGASLGCYQCFISVEDSSRLCMGHIKAGQSLSGLPSHDNIDSCFKKLDVIFNNNPSVISAARVGATRTLFKLTKRKRTQHLWLCPRWPSHKCFLEVATGRDNASHKGGNK